MSPASKKMIAARPYAGLILSNSSDFNEVRHDFLLIFQHGQPNLARRTGQHERQALKCPAGNIHLFAANIELTSRGSLAASTRCYVELQRWRVAVIFASLGRIICRCTGTGSSAYRTPHNQQAFGWRSHTVSLRRCHWGCNTLHHPGMYTKRRPPRCTTFARDYSRSRYMHIRSCSNHHCCGRTN